MRTHIKGWIGPAILGAGCAAVIVVLFLWHLWRAHGHNVAWGDVPTWLAFAAVFISLPAALVQLNLQRIQLREQQRELRQHQLVLDRMQANKVNLTRESSDSTPATYTARGQVWMAVITNDSERPIRNAVARIRRAPGGPLLGEARIGELTSMPSVQGGRSFRDYPVKDEIAIIRVSQSYGFAFSVNANEYPTAQVAVRFTDDAGLQWQLDQDLHLKKLNDRNDW